ncbi:MAG: hypothetical protein ISR58_18505 [Anaerolineales bacterium]|nr:hypothetical protein [Chloroflexota bacterium]MBL6983172.1 hypothetical protein [Anaerolineales bacterium]
MNSRERVRRIINRQSVDRIAIFDSFWSEVREDFHKQGVPLDIELEEFFDFDIGMFWFDQSFLLSHETVAEDDEYITFTDEWGTLNKQIKDKQTTPDLIDFPIKDRSTWETEFKQLLQYSPNRIDWQEMRSRYDALRAKDRYIVLSMLDPFESTWHKIGPEFQFIYLIEHPDWMIDMYDTDTRLIEDAWSDMWAKGLQPDALWLYGDIAYNHGMMFSPKHYQELLLPFHARLCELANRHGSQVIYHTDGNITKGIPLLIEAGIDCLHPLEVKAGMDVRRLKQDFGDQLAFMGNIDARLFQENDKEGLENEISEKLPVAMQGSGYIFHSDHSIPPGTTLETYRYTLNLVRDLGNF